MRRWPSFPFCSRVTLPLGIAFASLATEAKGEEPSIQPSAATEVEESAPALLVATPVVEVESRGDRSFGSRRLSRAEARQLPGAFGEPLRAIETFPGVTPTLSGLPYFYVRGAPPGNLGYFIDGIRLPALFHVLAGPSVLHPGMIDEVEFYAGPYPARYGRFAGGIAAGTLRPSEQALHGEASVRAFDSSGLVELPIFKNTSITLGGRFSYAGPIARLFAPEIEVRYWDYQARLGTDLSPRDRLEIFSFGSLDDLSDENDGERRPIFGSQFHRLQLSYQRQLDAGELRSASVFGWDRSLQRGGDVQLTDTLGQQRLTLVQRLGETTRLETGLDVGHDRYTLSLGAIDDAAAREDYRTRFPSRVDSVAGAHLAVTWNATARVHLTGGMRSDVYSSLDTVAVGVSPRVAAEFDVTPQLTLLSAFGIADQPPSEPLPQPGATPALGAGLQRALQSSWGLTWTLPKGVAVQATVFQNVLLNLSDGPGLSRLDNGDDIVTEQSRSIGASRGLELLLRRSLSQRLGGYLAYTLSTSQRSVGRVTGPALFDRRHVFSGAFSYRWGKGYFSGLRATLYTGIPADVAYIEAARNPPRTPLFHRLDFRAEKRFTLGRSGAYWAIVAEVLNTTLAREVLNMSCNAYDCRSNESGPVTIPSLGLETFF